MLDATVRRDGEQNRRIRAHRPGDCCERSLRIGDVFKDLEEQHEVWIMLINPLGGEVVEVHDLEVDRD
jgi:hypothetical protein